MSKQPKHEYLRADSFLFAPDVKDKWELIDLMADRLAEIGLIEESLTQAVKEAVVAREKQVSTGMESGVAIPHAAVEGLPSAVMNMAILPEGIEFDNLDGKLTKIVVMLLVPRHQKLTHVRILTAVARGLSMSYFREKLLLCKTGADVLEAWADGPGWLPKGATDSP